MERKKTKLFGLYVITDEKLTPYEGGKIFKCVESALKGGAKVVQLRDKAHTDEELLEIALQLKKLCHQYQALFIVNDRVKLAKGVEADGVHLGREDEALERAKVVLPDKIIGVSCYIDLERAKRAEALGASYVAFGSFSPLPLSQHQRLFQRKSFFRPKKSLKFGVCHWRNNPRASRRTDKTWS